MQPISCRRRETIPSLTIEDIPDELLEALRELAEQDRRSMLQRATVLLSDIIAQRREADQVRDEATRRADAWEQLAGRWTSSKSADEEIADISRARGPLRANTPREVEGTPGVRLAN